MRKVRESKVTVSGQGSELGKTDARVAYLEIRIHIKEIFVKGPTPSGPTHEDTEATLESTWIQRLH